MVFDQSENRLKSKKKRKMKTIIIDDDKMCFYFNRYRHDIATKLFRNYIYFLSVYYCRTTLIV